MKKILFLPLCLMIAIPLFVNAYSNNVNNDDLNYYKQHFEKMVHYYQKLYDCTPYSMNMDVGYQSKDQMKYQIFGKINGKCHVKTGSLNCYFPINVAKQYSKINEEHIKKKMDDMTSKKGFYVSTDEKGAQYIYNLEKQYCKYE